MKTHWRTEDRWLREYKCGYSSFYIATRYGLTAITGIGPKTACSIVEDAIRRAIRRRERKGKKSDGGIANICSTGGQGCPSVSQGKGAWPA